MQQKVTGEGGGDPGGGSSGGGSSGGGSTYLCTALYNMGYISKELWMNDIKYGIMTQKNNPDIYYGYAAWAKPLASYIQKDTKLAKIVRAPIIPFIRHWAQYMGHEMYPSRFKEDNLGRIFHYIGVSMSLPIGKTIKVLNKMKEFKNVSTRLRNKIHS